MTTSGTTRDNKWQRVTTSDNKWQWMTKSDNEWQGMTMSGTTSDNEWPRVTTSDKEWQWVVQQMTTNDQEWQRVTRNDNEWYNKWQRMTASGHFGYFFFFDQLREEPSTKHPEENSLSLEEDLWRKPIELRAEASTQEEILTIRSRTCRSIYS